MRKSTSGFTLVELLIVVVIIAILAAISIVAYNGVQNKAVDTAVQTDVLQNIKKMRAYYDVNGSFPDAWSKMVAPPQGTASNEFALTGSKQNYYKNSPNSSSNNSIMVCQYNPDGSKGWPSPTNLSGQMLVAISKTGHVYAATTDAPSVRDVTSKVDITSESTYTCGSLATYFGVYVGGAWYMTPYMTYSSN